MAKVKLNYALLCEQVIVDQSQKVSIIGAFNTIGATAVPAVHQRLTVIVNLYGDSGVYPQKIQIINLHDNTVIGEISGTLEVKTGSQSNLIATFLNTVFPAFGKYWIKVMVADEVLTNQDLHYVLVQKNN